MPSIVTANNLTKKFKDFTAVDAISFSIEAYENLILFAEFFDLPRKVAEERIDELLDFVELKQKRNNKIDVLSTGMKRRLIQ